LLLIPVLLMLNENLINKTEANIMRSVFPIGNFYTDNFKKMRSSLFSNEFETKNRGKSILGKVPMLFLFFIITIILTCWIADSNNQLLLIYLIIDAVIFGVLFIIAGWLEFSLLQTIEAIPISKIEGAAEGLNEIQGRLIPENGNPLTSPMSKQKCVFYQLELQQYVKRGKDYSWEMVARFAKATPTLLTDDTGYLAIDFVNADLTMPKSLILYPYSDNKCLNTWDKLGQELIKYFETRPDNFDVSNLSITFSPSRPLINLNSTGLIRIVENVMSLEKEYFAMGRVVNTNQTLNEKPVKAMIYDRSTKILSVRDESRRSLETKDKIITYFSLGFGVILLITGLFYLF